MIVGIRQGYLVLRGAAQMGPAEIRRALLDQLAVARAHHSRPWIVEWGLPVQENIHHPVGALDRNAGLNRGRRQPGLKRCTAIRFQEKSKSGNEQRAKRGLRGYGDRRNTHGLAPFGFLKEE